MDNSQEALEEFEKECGSLSDWEDQKEEWHTAFGFFLHGWICAKGQCHVCKGKGVIAKGLFDLTCAVCGGTGKRRKV